MENEYYFYSHCAEIGLRRTGEETVLKKQNCGFLLDGNVNGIVMRFIVERCNVKATSITVRKRLVLYKEKDCKDFAEAYNRYEKWKDENGHRAKSMNFDEESAKNIEEMYRQSYIEAIEDFKKMPICQQEFEYTMPSDRCKDTLTLEFPINQSKLKTETVYRLALIDCDEQSSSYKSWPWFIFFRCGIPLEQVYILCSASLRVRPVIRGKLIFDKAKKYRNYSNFFDDIHYDDVCEEVEINPTLVCFELQETMQLSKKYDPPFTVTMTSGGNEVLKEQAKILHEKNGHMIVISKLSVDYFHNIAEDGLVTAKLEVFDRIIALFDFSTKRTEEGEYLQNEL